MLPWFVFGIESRGKILLLYPLRIASPTMKPVSRAISAPWPDGKVPAEVCRGDACSDEPFPALEGLCSMIG